MKNWNFNGSLKENNKRVLTEAEGSINMVSARKDPSVSFNNDNGTLRMTLNIPAGGGGGETESGVGRTYVTEDGESRGEYFNVYEGAHIGNAIGKFSHAEGGNLFRESSSCLPHTKWVGKTIWIDRTRPEFSNLSSCQIYIESSIASGLNSHAEGFETAAIGDESHAEGYDTEAHGKISHAEGRRTIALGYGSHTEGYNTKAYGAYSHAEGDETKAHEEASHAEGYCSIANGVASHAEGFYSTANGLGSHAEGGNTTAKGIDAHAEGVGTIAGSDYQHVQGQCNIADYDNKYAMIIGNGSSTSDRANALTVDWDGNQTIAGELYIKNSKQPLIRCLTQSEYNSLETKNPYTLYLIKEA